MINKSITFAQQNFLEREKIINQLLTDRLSFKTTMRRKINNNRIIASCDLYEILLGKNWKQRRDDVLRSARLFYKTR